MAAILSFCNPVLPRWRWDSERNGWRSVGIQWLGAMRQGGEAMRTTSPTDARTAPTALPTAEKPTLRSRMTEEGCKVIDDNISGNTVAWSIKCTGKQELTGPGR
jgi:hypothetical protein